MKGPEETRHARLERLYSEASELQGDERASFLAVECADDDALREEIEQLIGFEPQLTSFDEGLVKERLRRMSGLPDSVSQLEQLKSWLPERIGSYSIKRQIGRGGMGVVFEAMQESPSRRVALKLSHPMVATNTSLKRLKREAEVLGCLQHPGIAQIYEAGVHDLDGEVQPYFAMEYIDGQDLLTYAKDKRLEKRARIELIISVCEGAQHAHEQGIVHRDLKPDNIFVDKSGQTKLLDFGVARLVEAAEVAGTLRTQAGELLGTLAYMAPEQATGDREDISPATDVFALGVIAYELLTGHMPRDMEGMTVTSALNAVCQTEPRRLRDFLARVEKDLDTVIGKALEMRRRDRYRNAAEFGADLRRVLERRPVSARPPTAFDRLTKYLRRNKALVLTAAAIGSVLVVALMAALRDARREADQRRSTLRDLYASEMLRATDRSSRVGGTLPFDELGSKWTPDEGEEDLRGWEWRFLNGLRRNESLSLPLVNEGMGVDWHPTKELVAVASVELVEVFDLATEQRVATWPGDDGPSIFLSGVRFSPDGERLLFQGYNGLGVWRIGEASPDWIVTDAAYQGGAWSPDGTWVVASDERRRSLVRFDAQSGRELEVLTPEAAPLDDRSVSADGRFIPIIGPEGAPTMFDRTSGQLADPLRGRAQNVICLMVDPSGSRLAESGWSNQIRLYPFDDPAAVIEIDDHNEQVGSVRWHPTENLIATGSGDASVRIYNAELGALMEVFRGHTKRVREVCWSPDGKRIASASEDRQLRIWDIATRNAYRRRTVATGGSPVFSLELSFNHDSSLIHVSYQAGAFTIAMPEGRVSKEGARYALAAFSHDGKIRSFARNGETGFEAIAEDVQTGRELWRSSYQRDLPTLRSWLPTERKLLVGGTLGLEMLDFTGEARTMWTFPGQYTCRDGAFSPDAAHVAVAQDRTPIRVFAVETGDVVMEIPIATGLQAYGATFSPSGELIAVPCSDGVIRVYEPYSGALVKQLNGHSGKVLCAGWHPTEPRLATGSADGSVKLWNTDSYAPTATFECGGTIKALDWSHDGGILAAMTAKGTIHFWEAFDASPPTPATVR